MEALPVYCLSAGHLSLSWISVNNKIKLQQTEGFFFITVIIVPRGLAFHSQLLLIPTLSGGSSTCSAIQRNNR